MKSCPLCVCGSENEKVRTDNMWHVVWLKRDHHVGLVVKASASRAADQRFNSCFLQGDYSGLSHTSDWKIGSPVATLPGVWRYRINAGTGWPGVSILWLGEVETLFCNFHLSVVAHTIVWADQSLRYASILLGHWATNKQQSTQSESECTWHCMSGLTSNGESQRCTVSHLGQICSR